MYSYYIIVVDKNSIFHGTNIGVSYMCQIKRSHYVVVLDFGVKDEWSGLGDKEVNKDD